MYRLLQCLVSVGLIVLLAACSQGPELNPLAKNAVILAFGDSLTYGSGTSQLNSYPNVLTRLISRKVINGGVPGDTTADAYKRLIPLLKKYKPQLVILCLGGNDMLRKVPHQTIADNLYNMISEIKSTGAQVLLIAVPKPSLSFSPPGFYKAIAKEQQVPVMLTLLPDLFKQRDMRSDMVHFNARGYREMAMGIFKHLRSLGAL